MMVSMTSPSLLCSVALLLGALLIVSVAQADEPPDSAEPAADEQASSEEGEPASEAPDPEIEPPAVEPDQPEAVEANVGRGGGLVRLPDGPVAALLPGSAGLEPGWHRLRLEVAEALLPQPEAVGTRPIDRRSSGPLGQVEGPPVTLSSGLRLRLVNPDPTEEVRAGMIDVDDWRPWLASVPADLMPLLPPEQEASRQGLLVAVPQAAPAGSKERLSAWLYSPGGMRRQPTPPGGRAGEVEAWDPCLKLGRIDEQGTAWFFLAGLTCGLEEDPVWTPLREQTQQEFADWVIEQSPPEQHRELRRELKQMARDEVKLEKDG